MQRPVLPYDDLDVSAVAPPERPRPEGLGWGLVASVTGHTAAFLFVAVGACDSGWITGEITEQPITAERAFAVYPVDDSVLARLTSATPSQPEPEPEPEPVTLPEAGLRQRPVPEPGENARHAERPGVESPAPTSPRTTHDAARRSPPPDALRNALGTTDPEPSSAPDDDPHDGLDQDDTVAVSPLDEVLYRRFLEVDDAPPGADVADADYIGARDAAPEKTTRSTVTADEAGPRMPLVAQTPSLPARARPQIIQGDPQAPRDQQAVAARAAETAAPDGADVDAAEPRAPAREAASTEAAAGGRRGTEDDGDDAPGGDTAASAGRAAAASVPSAASEPAEPISSSAEMAPLADAARPARAGDTDGDGVALAERPDDGTDRGGHAGEADETPRAGQGDAGGTSTGRGDAQGTSSAAGARGTDPVADLREALGWGAVDRDALEPSPGHPASAATAGGAASSPQGVVLDDVEIGAVSWARVADDPAGRYTDDVYRIVRGLWHQRDLGAEDKALGIQGRVTVEFVVARNGRVSDPHVSRNSGHDALDALALAAIPGRLPKFPRDLDVDSLPMRITFTYKNDLISGEDRP